MMVFDAMPELLTNPIMGFEDMVSKKKADKVMNVQFELDKNTKTKTYLPNVAEEYIMLQVCILPLMNSVCCRHRHI